MDEVIGPIIFGAVAFLAGTVLIVFAPRLSTLMNDAQRRLANSSKMTKTSPWVLRVSGIAALAMAGFAVFAAIRFA